MKKQGFTLIELMVVIVIMGILAAVAVPKLFGMIAKSKASEVGPAAGTYVKLQDAFISETGAYFGSWNTIGYQAPGAASTTATVGQTSNFKYTQEGSYDTEKGTASLADNDAASWAAENLLKLNDCTGAKNWQLKPVAGSNGQYTWYTKELGAGCLPLTPQFGNLGTSTFQ